jgi:hypothetical protein
LMNTFLDVLRVFTQHKFICFCLDDLQFADDESLELITQIVASRMKVCTRKDIQTSIQAVLVTTAVFRELTNSSVIRR